MELRPRGTEGSNPGPSAGESIFAVNPEPVGGKPLAFAVGGRLEREEGGAGRNSAV
jgi:hypothetical protein